MADVSFKKFTDLAATNTLIAADIIPVVTTTGGNNSKKITYESFAQTVSSTLITPFTNTITAITPASADKWNSTYSTVQSNSATWGVGGGGSSSSLTIFKQISSISSPNNTTTVHALSIISGQANVDIAILAKGNGATLAQIPDDGGAGGNKRGQYATDWQKVRSTPSQVARADGSVIGGGANNTIDISAVYSTVGGGVANTASGNYSTVASGSANTASGNYSTIGGGVANTASGNTGPNYGSATVGGGNQNTAAGYFSTIGGGQRNTASETHSTIAGGLENRASGSYSTIGGGYGLTASGSYSTIGGGLSISASGSNSTIGGGSYNIASASHATVIGGQYGVARLPGQLVYNTGYYTPPVGNPILPGDSQLSIFLLRKTSTSAGSSFCTLDGTNEITMNPSETMFVTATIGGLSSHNFNSSYFGILKAVVKCDSSNLVTVYNSPDIGVTRFPTTANATHTNASLSGGINTLRVVVFNNFANSSNPYKWNVKLEALSINSGAGGF